MEAGIPWRKLGLRPKCRNGSLDQVVAVEQRGLSGAGSYRPWWLSYGGVRDRSQGPLFSFEDVLLLGWGA